MKPIDTSMLEICWFYEHVTETRKVKVLKYRQVVKNVMGKVTEMTDWMTVQTRDENGELVKDDRYAKKD